MSQNYGSDIYMGEYASDAAAIAYLTANEWLDGAIPYNAVLYYNTTSNRIRIYRNSEWADLDLRPENTYVIAETGGDFKTLTEAITFLNGLSGQTSGVILNVDGTAYDISDTVIIDFPFHLMIQGSGSGGTKLQAATGLTNKPMFVVKSDIDLRSISIDGTTLASWGTLSTENIFEYVAEDGITWVRRVIDRSSTPPVTPVTGDRYLVIATASGAWTGHEDDIAQWNGSTWDFTAPTDGDAVWSLTDEAAYTYNVSAWEAYDYPAIYSEITDFFTYGGYSAFSLQGPHDLYIFNFGVYDCVHSGIDVNTFAYCPAIDAEIGDLSNCAIGVQLSAGVGAEIFLSTLRFINEAGQTAIAYVPADFTEFTAMTVTQNNWNKIGTFITGFDFTLQRDGGVLMFGNAGYPDKRPSCFLDVTGGTTGTTVPATTWTKANFTTSNFTGTKMINENNKITFLAHNDVNLRLSVALNIAAGNNGRTISLGMWKNGVGTGTLQARISVKCATSSEPYLMVLTGIANDVTEDDYFELALYGEASTYTVREVSWVCSVI